MNSNSVASALLNQATSPSDPIGSWMTPLVSLGGFGLLLVLLLTGAVVTKSTYLEMKGDRDAYKRTAEILLSNEQADVKRDEVLQRMFEEIREQSKNKGHQ